MENLCLWISISATRKTIYKITDVKEVTNQTRKILDAAITALFEFPAGIERTFNRSPLYRTIRGKSYGDGYLLLPPELQKEF